jgi:trehalose 6-phosphate synthase/phosphatase
MFRALLLFPPGTTQVTMEAPLSVTLIDGNGAPPVQLSIKPEAVFTTAVGHSSKRTLASWHVTTPQEIVDHMLDLVRNEGEEGEASKADDDDDSGKGKEEEKLSI